MLLWVQTYSAVNWQIIVSHLLVCLTQVWKFEKKRRKYQDFIAVNDCTGFVKLTEFKAITTSAYILLNKNSIVVPFICNEFKSKFNSFAMDFRLEQSSHNAAESPDLSVRLVVCLT